MQIYQNAASGLKNMFIAEVGVIICSVVAIIPFIGIIGVIGSLVFLIISLIGLNNAGKDIEGCKTAFTLRIVQLIVSMIGSFIGGTVIAIIINNILALFIIRAVCLSVADVLDTLQYSEIADKGRLVWKINLVCYVIAIILAVLELIPFVGIVFAVLGGIISAVLSLIAGILYIIFLSKSYKALEA